MHDGMQRGMQFYLQRGGFEHHGGHHWLALVLLVVLVVALLLIAASVARLAFSRSTSSSIAGSLPADDALSVLRLRYARGEVGREEFLLAHGDLGGGSPSADVLPA